MQDVAYYGAVNAVIRLVALHAQNLSPDIIFRKVIEHLRCGMLDIQPPSRAMT